MADPKVDPKVDSKRDERPVAKAKAKPSAKFGEVVRYVTHDGSEVPAVVHADTVDGFADLHVLDGYSVGLKRGVPHSDLLDERERNQRAARLGLVQPESDTSERPEPEVDERLFDVDTWRRL